MERETIILLGTKKGRSGVCLHYLTQGRQVVHFEDKGLECGCWKRDKLYFYTVNNGSEETEFALILLRDRIVVDAVNEVGN